MDHCTVKYLLLLSAYIHLTSAASHSLQYIYTAFTQTTTFPEFTVVGLLDGEQILYYDSNTRKMIPKTDWIKRSDDDPDAMVKVSVDTLMQRFNQTRGVQTLQRMFGCELHDDGTHRVYDVFGCDGEDALALDQITGTWTAASQEAVSTKQKWEGSCDPRRRMLHLEHECIHWLNKYMEYGRPTLDRKVPPEVSLFQKNSSSPVVCHATGFYPKAVMISWQKNGEDLDEDVDLREMLPNQDGTFQRRSILTVSPEELDRNQYTCVVQHGGLEREMVLQVSDHRVLPGRTNLTPQGMKANESLHVYQAAVKAVTVTHSLRYIYTAVTPGIDSPEYTALGLVDGEQFVYYDSNIRKMIPKTEWIKENEGEEYWNRETENQLGTQEVYKTNVATGMQRFNQTTGVHTAQVMYGCELDEDGTTRGYRQDGYDGEDFISLDLNTGTWTAANAKAVITKHKWEGLGKVARERNYLENICIEWLEKYVGYGRDTLERKVPPEISLFQKDSSSPVVCHATGFYPKAVMISWQMNGEDLDEGVELGETVPNQDGTFQKRSILSHLRSWTGTSTPVWFSMLGWRRRSDYRGLTAES
ncbi:hypothetical protein NFI96_026016 [Prochilodus magdalenae]|nr:hypothetical protein NFI96_026016 [Prochilodus magdalenae]